MDKVLTTTEFVLWYPTMDSTPIDHKVFANHALAYALLMQQPLELGMFVPCVDGKPIEEPKNWETYIKYHKDETRVKPEYIAYQQAKEQVLFEGGTWEKRGFNEESLHLLDRWHNFEKNGEVHIPYMIREGFKTSCGFNPRNIEELSITIDLKPTKAFLNKIGL